MTRTIPFNTGGFRRTDRRTDKQMDGQTNRWTDRQKSPNDCSNPPPTLCAELAVIVMPRSRARLSRYREALVHWEILNCKMRCTNPRLNNGYYNTKLAATDGACHEMEWIYTQTKVESQCSVELALEEKNTRRLRFFTLFMISLHNWFRHICLFPWMV